MNLHFLIIDPQNDFAHPKGSLFVPGADQDMQRLTILLKQLLDHITAIHVTLDTHHFVDIAHPVFWVDTQGHHPEPFTSISTAEVENQRWRTTQPDHQARALTYVRALQANRRYQLTIWPPHCLIGQIGHNVVAPLGEALLAWESRFKTVDYISKGANPWTEHYSAIQADVPDSTDAGTQLNVSLMNSLQDCDLCVVSGEALSHCVANTLSDIAHHLEGTAMRKFVLLEDTTSPVPGFEAQAEQFLVRMETWGMQRIKSTDFLKEYIIV